MLNKHVLRRVSELNRSSGRSKTDAQRQQLQARIESLRGAAGTTSARDAATRAARAALATSAPRPVRSSGNDAVGRGLIAPLPGAGGASGRGDKPSGPRSSELPEGRELETPYGSHYIIERPLSELWQGADRWLRRAAHCEAPSEPKSKRETGAHRAYRSLCHLREALADSTMFLDLETCGFSGSMVFLAGVLVAGPKEMTLLQLLARNYAEERAMLHTLWQVASQQTLLATFNGKSFDWPVVRDRTILHRLEMRGPLADESTPHCDLLHLSRRRWKRDVPNCKLQTLERYICGRRRVGDIAGRDIPDAYHDFVRTKDAWEMRSVLHHNALDLVTLLQLSLAMLCESGEPS